MRTSDCEFEGKELAAARVQCCGGRVMEGGGRVGGVIDLALIQTFPGLYRFVAEAGGWTARCNGDSEV
jgi:hypothetical protein